MRTGRKLLLTVAFAFPLALTVGCGNSVYDGLENKSSSEAKSFEAAQKLDKGNYDAILADPDSANAIDYTAAALGKMGYETTTLVDAMSQSGDSTSTQSDLSSILALETNPANIKYLDTAASKLETELTSNSSDEQLNLQRAILSFTKVNAGIAAVANGQTLNTAAVDNDTGFSIQANIDVDATDGLTKAEINAIGQWLLNKTDGLNSETQELVTFTYNSTTIELVRFIADEAFSLFYNNGGTISKAGLGNGSVQKNIEEALKKSDGLLGGVDLSNYSWDTLSTTSKYDMQRNIGNYLKNR